jgi:membrane protein DedA with SNARE-associated domain
MLEAIDVWIDQPHLLFWVCAATGLVIPLPEDVVLLYVGIRAHSEGLPWGWTFAAAAAGTLLRDVLVYFIGRGFGDWLFTLPAVERFLGTSSIERARQLFANRGSEAVIMGRFLVGMRVPFFCVAGALRTPFRKFLFWDAAGTLVTVPLLMAVGAWLGTPVVELSLWVLRRTGITMWAIIIVVAASWLWWRRRQEARVLAQPTGPGELLDREEVPLE